METKLEQIAAKAVKQQPKSVVREIRTPRSVGAGGRRLPPVTRCEGGNILTYSAILPPQRSQVRGEGCSVAQAIEVVEEGQPTRRVNLGEAGQEQPPEQAREHPHWHQEAGSARYPARAVE